MRDGCTRKIRAWFFFAQRKSHCCIPVNIQKAIFQMANSEFSHGQSKGLWSEDGVSTCSNMFRQEPDCTRLQHYDKILSGMILQVV